MKHTIELDGQKLPAKWTICSTCQGEGKRALHGIAITADEWNGPDWDDEMKEDYMNGVYDTPCGHCGGSGKLLIADVSRLTAKQRKIWRDSQDSDDAARSEAIGLARMSGDLSFDGYD